MAKDNFSGQASSYAQFRPSYPEAAISFLAGLVKSRITAWDCGTGNGQIAIMLSPHFETIYATDISEAQLANAVAAPNIIYKKEAAEGSAFSDRQFDLISVGQAIHWFDFDRFYAEVYRTLKDNGIFAVLGYALLSIDSKLDEVIHHLYTDILVKYWDPERRHVDEWYQNIPFPFEEIETPRFTQRYRWSFSQLLGYLSTWSAVQHFTKEKGEDPLRIISEVLKDAWGEEAEHEVVIPILMRVGRKRLA